MKKITAIILLLCCFSVTKAQINKETFGQNRIQYKNFEWKSYVSKNFEVYYYSEGFNFAKESTLFLEANFDRITDQMGHPPYSRTKIFLYNSVTDLQMSNVGVNNRGPISGAETEFVSSVIEIAHPGTMEGLKDQLLLKVTKVLLDEMLFGGSLKDVFQNTFMTLPDWLVDGAVLYLSYGWTSEMDDFIREYLRENQSVKLQKLTGREAALAGQSIWNFIGEKYGKSNISSILNYIKIIRNEEKSIAITLGVSFRELLIDWKRFYLEMDSNLDTHYVELNEETVFTPKNKRGFIYKNVHFSRDGMKIAYSRNDRGRYSVWIYDIASNEDVLVLKGGNRVIDQDVNYNLPLMAWVDDSTLGIIDARKGKLIFWLYDVLSGTKIPRPLTNLSEVNSLSFNGNGRLGIISGTVNGSSDLYLISTRRDRIKRLTNDFYDDIDPSFVPNTNSIVFSSNRMTDSLNQKGTFDEVSSNYNLYYFNLDTTEQVLTKITNTISRDTEPFALSYFDIMYLSDQKGINNLFKYNVKTGIYTQLTNFKTGIKEYHYNLDTRTLTFIAVNTKGDNIYVIKNFDTNQQNFTPPSTRIQLQQAKEVKLRREQKKIADENLSVREILDRKLEELDKEKASLDSIKNETEVLDTENYTFESSESRTESKPQNSFLDQYRRSKQSSELLGPYDFETMFNIHKVIWSAYMDPLRGFGMYGETEMKDLLENHIFSGGLMTSTDFRTGLIHAEYKYLKQRIDYTVNYNRDVLLWLKMGDINQPALDRYSSSLFSVTASYPINVKSRVSVKPLFFRTVYEELNKLDYSGLPTSTPAYAPSVNKNYMGGEIEFVFDNSLVSGLNTKDGTVGKVKFTHYENLGDRNSSLSNLSAEIRHYQKIHREIHLASRFYYGKFFGPSPKKYMLGGMDEWIFNVQNTIEADNPLNRTISGDRSDLLFNKFVGPMRGFKYSEFFGSDVISLSTELRIPLVQYFNSGYIPSNFFRNIQFIGFFDIGSAWSGKSPFNPDNTISTVKLPTEGAFEITLKNNRSPWLMSYGGGFRTMIFGYFVKFDLAWPVIDVRPEKPNLTVSLGFDF